MIVLLDLLGVICGISLIVFAFKLLTDRAQSTDLHVTGAHQHEHRGDFQHHVTGGYTVQYQVSGTARMVHELAQEDRDRIDRLQSPARVQFPAQNVVDAEPVTLRRVPRRELS